MKPRLSVTVGKVLPWSNWRLNLRFHLVRTAANAQIVLSGTVVEGADQLAQGIEFYIPHKPVIRGEAASTKLRVVFDASAKAHPNAILLNDCLYSGLPLQNKLWTVQFRSCAHPVAVVGDLKKAFLQVRIKASDRDANTITLEKGRTFTD